MASKTLLKGGTVLTLGAKTPSFTEAGSLQTVASRSLSTRINIWSAHCGEKAAGSDTRIIIPKFRGVDRLRSLLRE